MSELEKFREKLGEIEYPYRFEPKEWRDGIDASCYDYALGIKSDTPHMIGDFIGRRVTKKDRIDRQFNTLMEELEELGFLVITCSTDDLIDEEESIKIFVEWDAEGRVHFLRQDSDRGWSHKAVGLLPTQLDEEGYVIKDPETDCCGRCGRCLLLTRIQ